MSKKHPSDNSTTTVKPVRRREALKGLGALAISAPTLAAMGCSSDPPTSALNPSTGTPSVGGTGVAPTSGVAGMKSAAGVGSTTTGVAGSNTSTGTAGTVATPPVPSAAGTTGTARGTAGTNGATAGTGRGSNAGMGANAGGTPAAGSGGTAAGGGGMGGTASTNPGDFVPVTWDNVMSCTLTPTDPAGEGPFFVHEDEAMNDDSLRRVDMRGGKPGVELQLNLRVLDSEGKCMMPISGVDVYVWHTDASGFYSGFNNQNPNMTYTGGIERTLENMDRFCRGIQITDKDGIVRFKTVYPGWYNGRAIHIHFVALRPGSGPGTMSYRSAQYMVFTTQMYFAEQFSRMIHEKNEPYMARASGTGYNQYVKPQNMTVNPTMRMEGNIAVGALNIVTSGSGTRR